MLYEVKKGREVLGTVRASSARDAIEQVIEEQIPEDTESFGWRTRDFLKYSLTAKRIEGTQHQFYLKDMIWLVFALTLGLGWFVNREAISSFIGMAIEELLRF